MEEKGTINYIHETYTMLSSNFRLTYQLVYQFKAWRIGNKCYLFSTDEMRTDEGNFRFLTST
jgi:hypothetical protein